MRRSRAPGVIILSGFVACLLTGPVNTASAAGGETAVEAAVAPATASARAGADVQPPVLRQARSGRGFVCESRTVQVSSGTPSFKVAGILAVRSLDCHDCCQENILFQDGFEQNNTNAWSNTVP